MRGTPIWQVVFVMFMFAAAGVPILRLTAPAAPAVVNAAPAATSPATASTRLEVQASFAPAPVDFTLRAIDSTIMSGQGPTVDFTGQWTAALPAEGADLILQAHWPEASTGHVAAHVTVRFPDGRETAETFWRDAGQTMVETLTVKP